MNGNGVATNAGLAAMGTGVGTLLAWGIQTAVGGLTPAAVAALASATSALAVILGRYGIVGMAKMLWRGQPSQNGGPPK